MYFKIYIKSQRQGPHQNVRLWNDSNLIFNMKLLQKTLCTFIDGTHINMEMDSNVYSKKTSKNRTKKKIN